MIKANKNRGQGAVEFLIVFGLALFSFVTFFTVINSNIELRNTEKENIVAQNIALDVQYEIALASESSEGYYREFTLPQNILGKEYEINISGNRVYISGEKIGISYKVNKINGSIQKGANIIRTENETVFLN